MKKILFVFLFLTTLFSCNQGSKSEDKTNTSADTTQKTAVTPAADNSKKITGEWTITATISEGVEGKCKACPKINFNNDGTVIINNPKGGTENLKWELKDGKIRISTPDNTNPEGLFADIEYAMTFTQHKDSVKLDLVQAEKNYSYILNR